MADGSDAGMQAPEAEGLDELDLAALDAAKEFVPRTDPVPPARDPDVPATPATEPNAQDPKPEDEEDDADPQPGKGTEVKGPDLAHLPAGVREDVAKMPPEHQEAYLKAHREMVRYNNEKSQKLSDSEKQLKKLAEYGETFVKLTNNPKTRKLVTDAVAEFEEQTGESSDAPTERPEPSPALFKDLIDKAEGGGLEETLFSGVKAIAEHVFSKMLEDRIEEHEKPRKMAEAIRDGARTQLEEMGVDIQSEEAKAAWGLVREKHGSKLNPDNVGMAMELALGLVRGGAKEQATPTPEPAKGRRTAKVRTVDSAARLAKVPSGRKPAGENGSLTFDESVNAQIDKALSEFDLTEDDLDAAVRGFWT